MIALPKRFDNIYFTKDGEAVCAEELNCSITQKLKQGTIPVFAGVIECRIPRF
jgi:hypothetical protein